MRQLSIIIALLAALSANAQEAFRGFFYCEELKATMQLNLTEKNIAVTEVEEDSTYGVLRGNLNGIWVAMRVKSADDKKAVVRMINDIGNDAQNVELRFNAEGNLEMRLLDEQNIKTVSGRKYVKLPKNIVFKPMGKE